MAKYRQWNHVHSTKSYSVHNILKCNDSFGICICVRDSGPPSLYLSFHVRKLLAKNICFKNGTYSHFDRSLTHSVILSRLRCAVAGQTEWIMILKYVWTRKFSHKNIESHPRSLIQKHFETAKIHTWTYIYVCVCACASASACVYGYVRILNKSFAKPFYVLYMRLIDTTIWKIPSPNWKVLNSLYRQHLRNSFSFRLQS